MPTWTTPPTFVTGTTLTAANLNILSGDLSVLGGAWTDDAAARASTAIWNTTGASLGNGTLVSRYRLVGKTLDWLVVLTFGSTTSAGSGPFTFTYPGAVTPLNAGATTSARYFDNSLSNTYLGAAVVGSSTAQLFQMVAATGQIQSTTFAVPFTWATSDVCGFLLTGLEVA